MLKRQLVTCPIQGKIIGFARGWDGPAPFSVAAVVFEQNGEFVKATKWTDGYVSGHVISTEEWDRAVAAEGAANLDTPLDMHGHSEIWIMRAPFLGRLRAANDLQVTGSMYGKPIIGPGGVWACHVHAKRATKLLPRWLVQYYEQAIGNAQRGQWTIALQTAELAADLDRKFSPPVVGLLKVLCHRVHEEDIRGRPVSLIKQAYTANPGREYREQVEIRAKKLSREISSMTLDMGDVLDSISDDERQWIQQSPHAVAAVIRRAYTRLKQSSRDIDARDDLIMALEDMRSQRLVLTSPMR